MIPKAIFSSVNSLGEDEKQGDDEFDETLESEIVLLEKVVKKIAALAELSCLSIIIHDTPQRP